VGCRGSLVGIENDMGTRTAPSVCETNAQVPVSAAT